MGEFDTELGQYTIVKQLGTGGMGTVYAARDSKLERMVALKLLHGTVEETEKYTKLLLREARTLAKLSHPNVVSVFDIGVADDHVFLVMEYVEGRSLDVWLDESRRSTEEIVRKLIDAGRGLAAAHAAGIVHGDFKPGNVLVGDDDRVKVADFGIARPIPEGQDPPPAKRKRSDSVDWSAFASTAPTLDTPLLTNENVFAGTPAFMAPEQFTRAGFDSRTDQFSFCVALHSAVFGQLPFEGDSFSDFAENVVSGRRKPSPAQTRKERALARILDRGLATHSSDRFQSMEELVDELSRLSSGRRRILIAVLAAAALVMTGVALAAVLGLFSSPEPCGDSGNHLVGVWDPQVSARVRDTLASSARGRDAYAIIGPTLDRYASSWATMHRDACEATYLRGEQSEALLDLRMVCLDRKRTELVSLRDLLLDREASLPRLVEVSQRLSEVRECSDLVALSAPARGPVGEGERAVNRELRTLAARLRVLNMAGSYAQVLELAGPAAAEAKARGLHRARGELLYTLGVAEREIGEFENAEGTLMHAVEAAEAARDQLGKVRAWSDLIYVVGHDRILDHWKPWAQLARAALSGLEGSAGREPKRHLHYALGAAWGARHASEKSLAEFRQLERMARQDGDAADLAIASGEIGTTYHQMGSFDEARRYLELAIEQRSEVFGADHPLVAESKNNLGVVEAATGNLERARQLVEEGLAMRRRVKPPSKSEIAESYSNLGGIAFASGEPESALEWFTRSLDLEQEIVRPEHPSLAGSMHNLALVYLELDRPGEARALLERAAEIIEKNSGYFDRPAMLFALAQGLATAGSDRKLARRLAEQARSELARVDPENPSLNEIDAWLQSRR